MSNTNAGGPFERSDDLNRGQLVHVKEAMAALRRAGSERCAQCKTSRGTRLIRMGESRQLVCERCAARRRPSNVVSMPARATTDRQRRIAQALL